jgi:hypothetical protein
VFPTKTATEPARQRSPAFRWLPSQTPRVGQRRWQIKTVLLPTGDGIAIAHAPVGAFMRTAIRWFRALMNSMARWRYPKYASRVRGTGDVMKPSNGMKNATVEVTGSTRSCRWKNATYPAKLSNRPKKAAYRAIHSPSGEDSPR